MQGIITEKQIDEIRETFGDEIARKAEIWTGTFIELLKSEGVL